MVHMLKKFFNSKEKREKEFTFLVKDNSLQFKNFSHVCFIKTKRNIKDNFAKNQLFFGCCFVLFFTFIFFNSNKMNKWFINLKQRKMRNLLAKLIFYKPKFPSTTGLVSLINRISVFVGYVMPKPYFQKNSITIQPITGEGLYFIKGTDPKLNVITRLEFELTYFEIVVEHVSHNTTRTPLDHL